MNPPAHDQPGDAATLATMSTQIVGLKESVDHLRDDLKSQSEMYVRNDVYQTRVIAVDREIVEMRKSDDRLTAALDRAVDRLEAAARERRIPWTAVGSFVVSAAALWLVLTGGA